MKSGSLYRLRRSGVVAPFAGAWIEMQMGKADKIRTFVAPFAGAWIEIAARMAICWTQTGSLPSRERGLKFGVCVRCPLPDVVAPFAGAWIEIVPIALLALIHESLPSRERGLKLFAY